MHVDHTAQLFDDAESLGRGVAAFLDEGVRDGNDLFVLARPIHVESIANALTTHGHSMTALVDEGRLKVVDAATALRAFMFNGRPNPRLFDETLAAEVRRRAGPGNGLRVYGELVDVLVGDGNIRATEELEDLWNELSATTPTRLHCGYGASNFTVPAVAPALASLCLRHTRVHCHEDDLLATWILDRHGRAAVPGSLATMGSQDLRSIL
jgi:hypothetical protein